MSIKTINFQQITQSDIDQIVFYLNHEKVIVCPTDTIYGLSCIATSKQAINKINKIKQRKINKAFIILINGYAMLKKYCYVNAKQLKYLKILWPGPISVILNKKENLSDKLTGGLDSVAVRFPNNNFLIKIIKKINQPLVSTSLNVSGSEQKPISCVKYLDDFFKNYKPDLIIDAGRIRRVKPSRLIDLRDMDNIKVLRR